MKSVSFPVSWLNPSSEIINEEAGVRSLEILSTVSWGISMRLRTALALSGDGTGATTYQDATEDQLRDGRYYADMQEYKADRAA